MLRFRTKKMNGIFAIEKPSGVTSSKFLGDLQQIFTQSKVFEKDMNEARSKTALALGTDKKWTKDRIDKRVRGLKVKMGHGGTLDPLASGVLIVGVGTGTKKLLYYLGQCNKTYETKALLGISTTTGDAEGEILVKNSVSHITKQMVMETAPKFVGDLEQTPPIFSALKMNGKPLYDYAREGLPLPQPIKLRKVKVHSLTVDEQDVLSTNHEFEALQSEMDEDGNPKEGKLAENPTLHDAHLHFSDQYKENNVSLVGPPKLLPPGESLPPKLPLLHFTTTVSSGTYIRSLVSDFGRALESSAYMVELIRQKQSDWELGRNVFKMSDFTDRTERVWGRVLSRVLANGPDIDLNHQFQEIEVKFQRLLQEVEDKQKLKMARSSQQNSPQELTQDEETSTTPSDDEEDQDSKRRKIDQHQI